MNKITIFLDIDGVLSYPMGVAEEWKMYRFPHSEKINQYFHSEGKQEKLFSSMALICPYNVEEFNILCRVIGYENIDRIVISSTWRVGNPLSRIKTIFYLKGMDYEIVNKINDVTPTINAPTCYGGTSSRTTRGDEIMLYIKEHGLSLNDCLVVDDIDLSQYLGESYYDLCDYIKGFEYNGVKRYDFDK